MNGGTKKDVAVVALLLRAIDFLQTCHVRYLVPFGGCLYLPPSECKFPGEWASFSKTVFFVFVFVFLILESFQISSKVAKWDREALHTPHPLSPPVTFSHSYTHLPQLRQQQVRVALN